MKNTCKRRRLCVTLLIANLIFIWGNSLLPGEVSSAFSRWVKDILEALFSKPGTAPGEGHGLLRKIAHFTQFATLGMLLTWLLAMLEKKPWLTLLYGFSVACMDEGIQCFIPERGPSIKDVLLDTAGAAFGMGLLLIGYTIYKNRKIKSNLEETKQ